jgi:tetratricopeptide (TPR) repeat protein
MKVAWQLRHAPEAAPAEALLLPSDRPAELLALHAQLGEGQGTSIYHTAAGLLVKLGGHTSISIPGAVRLRKLNENLLVPVDAELIPALHLDEAESLVDRRGLVFLPHREPLAYDPACPIPLSTFLTVPQAARPAWASFPQPRVKAPQIERILYVRPEDPEIDILGPGGTGIGDQAGIRESLPLRHRVTGWLSVLAIVVLFTFTIYIITSLSGQLGAARGDDLLAFLLLLALGMVLFARFLARPLTKLIGKAASVVPFLSEHVIEQQDAALRTLLRKFQAGKIDEALSRALPMSSFAERGSTVATSARLPVHNLLYSLGQLLGSGGPVALWQGGAQSQLLLAQEYRKAAVQAAARGDHRRAAYIYAKLLGDFRAAANVLKQGGLFHDAAILFLKRVHDHTAAAQAFEAGGEFDRALELYLERGQPLEAAELLRRAGDEQRALEYFKQAAQYCIDYGSDYLAAGDLIRTKAGRADLALAYYETGWQRRPGKNDVPCALALARLFTSEQSIHELKRLLSETEESLPRRARERDAIDFYNEVARLAANLELPANRDDVRDRCLIDLAGILRGRLGHEVKPAKYASSVINSFGAWDAAVVSDADCAWKAALREQPVAKAPRPETVSRLRFWTSQVTAVCQAPSTGQVFLGFEDGSIGSFYPAQSRWWTITQPKPGSIVAALAATADASCVVARFEPARDTKPLLRGNRRKRAVIEATASQPLATSGALRSYAYDGSAGYRLKAEISWEDPETLMAPLLVHYYGLPLLALVKGQQFLKLDGRALVCISVSDLQSDIGDLEELMVLPIALHDLTFPVLIVRQGATLSCSSAINRPSERRTGHLGWTPRAEPSQIGSGVSWMMPGANLFELAAIDMGGYLRYSEVDLGTPPLGLRTASALGNFEGCLATCLVGPKLVAAVMPDRIEWFRVAFPTLSAERVLKANFAGARACLSSPATSELLIVFHDGELARVPAGA